MAHDGAPAETTLLALEVVPAPIAGGNRQHALTLDPTAVPLQKESDGTQLGANA